MVVRIHHTRRTAPCLEQGGGPEADSPQPRRKRGPSQGAPRRDYAAEHGSNSCIPRCRPRAEARSPLRPVSHLRSEDGRVSGFEVVGHRPRSGDAAGEPPAATHKGRRRARLQRTQERFQADHRLAPEGSRASVIAIGPRLGSRGTRRSPGYRQPSRRRAPGPSLPTGLRGCALRPCATAP
jgi:hypothetical protein